MFGKRKSELKTKSPLKASKSKAKGTEVQKNVTAFTRSLAKSDTTGFRPGDDDDGKALCTSKPESIPISDIEIGPDRRKLNSEAVETMSESMSRLGQLEPIIVRKGKVKTAFGTHTALVVLDGHHRIKAAERLDWREILAVRFLGDEETARDYEITKNLHRSDITRLDRAKYLAEYVRRRLGDSRAKELAQPGGRQPKDKRVSKTARELGYTRDDIRRSLLIASMSEEAMEKAVSYRLHDNEKALVAIAKKKNPDEQVAEAEKRGAKKPRAQKSADPESKERDEASYNKIEVAWKGSKDLRRALPKATENAFNKFIRKLQSIWGLAQIQTRDGQSQQEGDDSTW